MSLASTVDVNLKDFGPSRTPAKSLILTGDLSRLAPLMKQATKGCFPTEIPSIRALHLFWESDNNYLLVWEHFLWSLCPAESAALVSASVPDPDSQ